MIERLIAQLIEQYAREPDKSRRLDIRKRIEGLRRLEGT